MPSRELIRWDFHPKEPNSLSITPDMELLAVVHEDVDDDDDDDDEEYYELLYLQVHRPTDGSLTKSMLLPREVQYVPCAAKLPNETFVMSYVKRLSDDKKIGILSTDGEILSFVRTLDLGFFESIKLEPWQSSYNFVVKDDGEIFLLIQTGAELFGSIQNCQIIE